MDGLRPCSTPWSSSVPAPSGWPPPPTPPSAAWTSSSSRPARTPAPPSASGRTCGCSRPGASSSTPPPAACSRPPAPGPRPTTTPTRPAASGASTTSSRWPTCSTPPPVARCAYDARVVGVGRAGRDLLVDSGREDDPFAVHVEDPAGRERLLASAVVDASGTWTSPNPLGADGYPALGRARARRPHHLRHPRLRRPGRRRALRRQARRRRRQGRLGPGRAHRAGRGSPDATPTPGSPGCCAARSVGDAFGGGDNDQLEQRGKLGQDAKAAAAQRRWSPT